MKSDVKASEAPWAGCPFLPVFDTVVDSQKPPAYFGLEKRRVASSQARRSPGGKHLNRSAEANRILLIGRIQELALYRAQVLGDRGFDVRVSTSREDALRLIRRGGFDAAVLSYTLSSDTVEELAQEIRDQHPQCPLVVIANTEYPDRKIGPDAVALAEEGPKALVAALRQVLRRQ